MKMLFGDFNIKVVGRIYSYPSDHILTERRRHSSVLHISDYSWKQTDNDLYLVEAKVRD
jgi:hypothetical protein